MKYSQRIQSLANQFSKYNIDAFLVEHPVDILYLTGIEMSSGSIVIDSKEAHLIVDGRYLEKASRESPISVLLLQDKTFEEVLKKSKNLGFSKDTTSYQRFLELQEKLPKISLLPIDNLVKKGRIIKDSEEIERLKSAAKLGSQGFDFVCKELEEGISEKEVASRLEIFWLKKGGEKLSFEPIIAFGENTSMPHYHPSERKLRRGDPVLIDIGVCKDHYQSDMTRVIFFEGEPSAKIKEVYEIVKEAQRRALQICKAGITVGMLDAVARDYIAEKGYGDYFPHGLGHGVGLEIHEAPVLRNKPPYNTMVLQKGMVITVEPGVYLPKVGGVRLENTVVVTEEGYEDLTQRPC